MEAAGRRYIQHPSRKDEISVWAVGDIHLGNPGCDEKRCKRDIAAIKDDPNSFWIGLGDNADYISPNDKRFSADHLDDGAKLNIGRLGAYYRERVRDLFMPIKDKCLGLLLGNHEQKYFQDNNQEDGHGWLCVELGVPNLQYCALFDLVFVRKACKVPKLLPSAPAYGNTTSHTWRLYCHHGSGSSSTPGGKLNTLIKHMNFAEADIYLLGHMHDQKGQRMVRLGANADCTHLEERVSLGCISGSYLRTYQQGKTGYGEVKGYAPTTLGACRLRFRPDKHTVDVSV